MVLLFIGAVNALQFTAKYNGYLPTITLYVGAPTEIRIRTVTILSRLPASRWAIGAYSHLYFNQPTGIGNGLEVIDTHVKTAERNRHSV